jgi:hypothetical protein
MQADEVRAAGWQAALAKGVGQLDTRRERAAGRLPQCRCKFCTATPLGLPPGRMALRQGKLVGRPRHPLFLPQQSHQHGDTFCGHV